MGGTVLIEFFDHESLENIISLEADRYENVFYLCFPDTNEPTSQEKRILSSFLQRQYHTPTEFILVEEMSVPAICSVFSRLMADADACVIDLTGGSEVFSAAAGFCVAQHPDKPVTLQQYNVQQGKRTFCYPSAFNTPKHPPLSVPEAVFLHGAAALENTVFSTDGRLDEEVLRLWDAVKDVPRQWNHFCTLPTLTPPEYRFQEEKGVFSTGDQAAYDAIAPRLRRKKIIQHEITQQAGNREYRMFDLNVPKEAQFLYDKGGNLLEFYCALAAHRSGVFDDCRVGVILDWDGEKERQPLDVRNEVDVMLTYGHIPIFISCKNTKIENEHLYEIMTMARHYGGRYARAAIVSNVENLPAVRKRAKEMGILMADALYKHSLTEFIQLFRTHFPPRT